VLQKFVNAETRFHSIACFAAWHDITGDVPLAVVNSINTVIDKTAVVGFSAMHLPRLDAAVMAIAFDKQSKFVTRQCELVVSIFGCVNVSKKKIVERRFALGQTPSGFSLFVTDVPA